MVRAQNDVVVMGIANQHRGYPVSLKLSDPEEKKKEYRWCDIIVLYLLWGTLGFVFGFHWLVKGFYFDKTGKDVKVSLGRVGLFWLFTALAFVGGFYCRKNYMDCSDGEDMSRECLWSDQTLSFQISFIIGFVCIVINVWLWIFDAGYICWISRRSLALQFVLPFMVSVLIFFCLYWLIWSDWDFDCPEFSDISVLGVSDLDVSNSYFINGENMTGLDFLLIGVAVPTVLSIFVWILPCFSKSTSK